MGVWGSGGARSPVTACVCGPVDLVSERLVASPAEAKQSDSWSLGTPGAGGPGLGAPWPEREGEAWLGVSSDRGRGWLPALT